MITLMERPHDRLSGVTSIFLYFKHNVEVESIIKCSGTYNYDGKTHEWEVPVTSLAFLLDNLTYLDDLQLILYQKSINNAHKRKPLLEPKIKSFRHQIEAVEYGLSNDKWLLLDSPGLGKTKMLINLAEELKYQDGIEHCLVICGINTLKTNWEKEIQKHSDLDSIIIGKKISSKGNVSYESITKRVEQLSNPIKEFFIIINIESLRDDRVVEAILHSNNKIGMMIVDEVHKCAGVHSQQSENLLKLQSNYMIAATGSLILNNPVDCYIPLAWIGKERKRNVTNYRKTYCIYDSMTKGRIIGYKNLEILKDEIESCSLRRTKDLLDLPPKNIINEFLDMDDNQSKFYQDVKKGVKEECDKINLNASSLLALTTRLRQATSCPEILTSNENVHSCKIDRCVDLVDEIVSNGDKVVIFSNFKEPVYQLQKLLSDYNPLIGTGDMKDEEVSRNIDLFQNDDNYKVFIGTAQKMGTGVTLTSASYMIHIDLPWTQALYIQACDRIHRLGSKKPVFIYNLICNGTIDNVVLSLIERKGAMSDYIIDDSMDDRTINILRNYILDL